jgi:hypothetical protein
MASAMNNTTGLASSMTIKSFQDVKAKMISGAVARQNYRTTGMSNAKMNELRQYVYKMVSNWSREAKLRIIAEHGDADMLRNRPGNEELNRQTTETLIINLKTEDLEVLLRDIKSDEIKLKKDVMKYRADKKRYASTFTTRTFEVAAAELMGKNRPGQLLRGLRKEFGFKIPRNVKSQFKALSREINSVLDEIYNIVELSNLAVRLGIQSEVNLKPKEVKQFIINKVLMYAALITGKTKFSVSTTAMDTETYNEILSFTSYAYITGKPGMSTDEVIKRRKAMALAVARQKIAFGASRKPGVVRKVFSGVGKALRRLFKMPSPKRYEVQGLYRYEQNPETGETVPVFNYEKIYLEAEKYQISTKNVMTRPDEVINKINEAYSNTINAGKKRAGKVKTKKGGIFGLFGKRKSPFEIEAERTALEQPFEEGSFGGEKYSVPTVFISEDGQLNKMSSLAVPVFVVNEMARRKISEYRKGNTAIISKNAEVAGNAIKIKSLQSQISTKKNESGKILSDSELDAKKKELETLKSNIGEKSKYILGKAKRSSPQGNEADYLTGGSGGAASLLMSILKNKSAREEFATEYGKLSNVEILDEEYARTTTSLASADETKPGRGMTSSKSLLFKGLTRNDPFVADLSNYNKALKLNNNMALRVFDTTALMLAKEENKKKKVDSTSELLSKSSLKLGVKSVRSEPATPVFIVNKAVPTDVVQAVINVIKVLAKSIPFVGGVAAEAIESMVTGEALTLSDVMSGVGFATGGRGQALSKPKTHFISGDSLTKKPNPEQVSIDWSKKSYTVKPIPKFAAGGGEDAGAGRYTRMTTTERNMPMSVGISSHTITYNRNLGEGIKDDGSKQAIKVYSVNPGISDLIDIGGTSVSLIGLVADMTRRLVNIEGLLAIGNQQQQGLLSAANVTAASTSSIASNSRKSGGNPFLENGFPSKLDSILQGS